MIDGMAPLLARSVTERYVNSARPQAPVVTERSRRVARSGQVGRMTRVRSAVASVLHRTADAIAPQCPPRAATH